MPLSPSEENVELIRIVRGVEGRVAMEMELVLRFGYGTTVPWVRRRDYGLRAVSGPDAVDLVTPVPLIGKDMKTYARFAVEKGQSVPFTLAYHPSHREPRFVDDRQVLLRRTAEWWQEWSGRCRQPPAAPPAWAEAVIRSLITLKAMTFLPTGGLVAGAHHLAAGAHRRPAQLGLPLLLDPRCHAHPLRPRQRRLLRGGAMPSASGCCAPPPAIPEQMQIMYGLAGERRLTEIELPWLPGYEGSRPVRIGNAAHGQLQLDVYGELMDSLHTARRSGVGPRRAEWRLQAVLLKSLERLWRKPDEGIWEVRSAPRHFTYSKVMAWVAFDRGIKAVEQFGLEGPVDHWRQVRDEIRADILANGYDASGIPSCATTAATDLDAALLLIAQVGFLPPGDPRFRGTVAAIERDLVEDGFVLRYRAREGGRRPAGAGGRLPRLQLLARRRLRAAAAATTTRAALFERLLAVRNDLGLLAEQYDPRARRQLGNFPQAFSHVGLINTAHNLLEATGPAAQRADHQALPQPSEATEQPGTADPKKTKQAKP